MWWVLEQRSYQITEPLLLHPWLASDVAFTPSYCILSRPHQLLIPTLSTSSNHCGFGVASCCFVRVQQKNHTPTLSFLKISRDTVFFKLPLRIKYSQISLSHRESRSELNAEAPLGFILRLPVIGRILKKWWWTGLRRREQKVVGRWWLERRGFSICEWRVDLGVEGSDLKVKRWSCWWRGFIGWRLIGGFRRWMVAVRVVLGGGGDEEMKRKILFLFFFFS